MTRAQPPLARHLSRRRLLGGAGAAAASLAGASLWWPASASATPMAKVRERGSLVVGLYNDMPPFHMGGKGIDVDLAQALAEALQLKLTLLPFNADENMNDDLRNMVWRGHYLGFGPADVLLHVPVDKPLMDATPQCSFFGPYFRERVVMARNLAKLPKLEQLSDLGLETVAVPGQTLAGWLMIGAEGGKYRNQLRTKLKDGVEAAQLMVAGEVHAAAGLISELQSVVRDDPRFAIDALPMPRAPRDGWAVGMAVKKDSTELAQALQGAVNELSKSGRLKDIFRAGGVTWRPV